jgi:hypothetical protein
MARYQAEIAEAAEMLNRISREAEEAKADPDWVKYMLSGTILTPSYELA